MRMIRTAALLAVLFLIGPTIALARSTFAPATLEKYFTLDWQVVGETTTWVLGGVPGHNRAWFSTRVPEAANYRVEILSFDWIPRGQ